MPPATDEPAGPSAPSDAVVEPDAQIIPEATAAEDPGGPHPAWAHLGKPPGSALSASDLFKLSELAREAKDDPQPHLIMAQAYLQRRSFSNAQTRYEWAYRASSEARRDPAMLPNLLTMVTKAEITERSAALVERAYGAEALPALDEAIARERRGSYAAKRLAMLRRKIAPD